jgi:hypothetical protein
MAAGATTAVAGGAMVLVSGGAFAPGYAFIAVGGTTAGVGGVIATVGAASETFGASILFAQGDPQPLQSATLNIAVSRLEDLIGLTGLPVGVTDPTDSAINIMVGPRRCAP